MTVTRPGPGGGQGRKAPPGSDAYQSLLARVDDFWRRAVARQPRAFRCAEGCADCCQPRLSVRPVEAASIRAAVQALPPAMRTRLAARAETRTLAGADGDAERVTGADACVFLENQRCAIYAARPVICRTHGLAVRVRDPGEMDRLDWCPKNFTEEPPHPEGVLDLEHINTLLLLVDRLYLEDQGRSPDDPRIRLVDLAREATGSEPPEPDSEPDSDEHSIEDKNR